jgi:hypothetical protein
MVQGLLSTSGLLWWLAHLSTWTFASSPDRYRDRFAHSIRRAKVRKREAVAVHGLDDLGDGYLLFSLGIAFGLSKEGAGLLQQVLEPAVGQGLLSGGR